MAVYFGRSSNIFLRKSEFRVSETGAPLKFLSLMIATIFQQQKYRACRQRLPIPHQSCQLPLSLQQREHCLLVRAVNYCFWIVSEKNRIVPYFIIPKVVFSLPEILPR